MEGLDPQFRGLEGHSLTLQLPLKLGGLGLRSQQCVSRWVEDYLLGQEPHAQPGAEHVGHLEASQVLRLTSHPTMNTGKSVNRTTAILDMRSSQECIGTGICPNM